MNTETTDAGEIFYYFTVIKGTDGFWITSAPHYLNAFSIWASSITA